MRVYINVETIPPLGSKPDPATVRVPGNYTKPDSIKRYQEENAEEAWRMKATDLLQAQIVIISLLPSGDCSPPVVLEGKDEKKLLLDFKKWIDENKSNFETTWQTWNGLSFDYPMLRLRGMKHSIAEIARAFEHPSRPDYKYGDLMVELGGRGSWLGLDKTAAFLGIENDNPISGAEVPQLIWGPRHDLVLRHTKSRVTLLREIERRM